MSTPASLLHSADPRRDGSRALPPALETGYETIPTWKAELNARLREHRERRGEAVPSVTPAALRNAPRRTGAPASQVAARVAERYSNAPSYQDLLAASAAAAALAAETALEAHAAAEAALSDWENRSAAHLAPNLASNPEPASIQTGAPQVALPAIFEDDFFTPDSPPASQHPSPSGPRWEELVPREPAPSPSPASSTPARAASVEHHIPLPERSAPPARTPTRLPMAELARSFVDAFAEAVVPAAQSLPAKLIEFPRELIAPRKQRPRLAEGPLFEGSLAGSPFSAQETPGISLRIFEVNGGVGGEVEGQSRVAADPEAVLAQNILTPATDGAHLETDTIADVSFMDSYRGSPNHEMTKRSDYEDEIPRRRGSFHIEADGYTNAPTDAAPTDTASGARPSGTSRVNAGASRDARGSAHTSGPAAPLRQPVQQESGWGSIRLGEHPQTEAVAEPVQSAARRPEHGYREETAPALHDLAPISDRLMAALLDGGVVLACFLLSVLVFVSCTLHPPVGNGALVIAMLTLGALATFYGWLFMSYGGGSTPGMKYARIALCTFSDDNPTRKDLQNRIPATALALLPIGLGVFWALLDEDKLGWHDRMTRTYQRSYR